MAIEAMKRLEHGVAGKVRAQPLVRPPLLQHLMLVGSGDDGHLDGPRGCYHSTPLILIDAPVLSRSGLLRSGVQSRHLVPLDEGAVIADLGTVDCEARS